MKIKLLRGTEGDIFTEGRIYVDKKFECYTVEDTDRHLEDRPEDKIYGQTAIPRGTYRCTITHSTRFNKPLILLKDVPGFTGIRIHSGNSSFDTEGCIIVGAVNKHDDDNWVSKSRIAYNSLHGKVQEALDKGEEVTIEVV